MNMQENRFTCIRRAVPHWSLRSSKPIGILVHLLKMADLLTMLGEMRRAAFQQLSVGEILQGLSVEHDGRGTESSVGKRSIRRDERRWIGQILLEEKSQTTIAMQMRELSHGEIEDVGASL